MADWGTNDFVYKIEVVNPTVTIEAVVTWRDTYA